VAIAQTLGVDIFFSSGKLAFVDGRKGTATKRSRPEVNRAIGSSRVTGPNCQTRKNRLRCEVSAGVWNRESGDRAEVVAVHASASLAPSQELSSGA